MAHDVRLSVAAGNALADALAALCDGGTLNVYDGTQPADPDTATSSQTLLASCGFASPAFSAASSGIATAHAIASDPAAEASGTAAWFRIFTSGGDPVLDGTVGVGSGFDCDVASVTVTEGAAFDVSAMTLTAPVP